MSRAVLALVLEAVFLGLAFGWRSVLQWRRTGSTGFVRPRSDAEPAERIGAVAFVVALVLLVAAPIAALVGLDPWFPLDSTWVAIVGTVLGMAGIVLTVIAQLSMGSSWRVGVDPQERTELVTSGPFARVRNPIFTAMIIATAGLVLLVPNAISAAALMVLVAGLTVQVRLVEEPYLHGVHGDAYERYRRSSGRFIPRYRSSR